MATTATTTTENEQEMDRKIRLAKCRLDRSVRCEKVRQAVADSVLNLFKDKGTFDFQYEDGDTPLGECAYRGLTARLYALLTVGADTEYRDSRGYTPFYCAISVKQRSAAKMLLEFGADINATQDENGLTPLIDAFSRKDLLGIQFLVKKGADLSVTDRHGNNPLMIATSNDDRNMVELLIKAGSPLNQQNNEGYAPIHVASDETGKMLVEAGADPNLLTKSGMSPLWSAASTNDFGLVKSLLEAGANPFHKDEYGVTVEEEITSGLLQHGEDKCREILALLRKCQDEYQSSSPKRKRDDGDESVLSDSNKAQK